MEFNALFLCVLHFLASCRKFGHRASVDDVDLLRTKAQRGSGGIHRNVSASDNNDLATLHYRGVALVAEGLHEVASGQELVGRVHALEGFTRNSHEVGQSCTGSDENGLVALFEELVNREGLADYGIGHELHAKLPERSDFLCHYGLGKPELGDSVDQNAAFCVKGLVDRDFESRLGKVACAGESRRSGTYDCHLMAV